VARTVSGRKTLHYRDLFGKIRKLAKGPVPDRRLRPVSGLTDANGNTNTASIRACPPAEECEREPVTADN